MKLIGAIRGNRDLVRVAAVCGAGALSRWALVILIGLYAYARGGASAVGLVALARIVPAAVLGPWLALHVDRSSKRRALLVSLAGRTAGTAAMAAVVAADLSLGWLVAAAVVFTVADVVDHPALASLTQMHARNPTELASVNALWTMLDNGGFLVGSLLVGVCVAALGMPAAFAACVVPLVASVLVAAALHRDLPFAPLEGDEDVGGELLAGVRSVAGDGDLRLLVGVHALTQFCQSVIDVLIVVLAASVLTLGAEGAGWLSAAWGVGAIAGGAVVAARFAGGRVPAGLRVGLVASGLPLVAVGLWPDDAFAIGAFVALGVGMGMVEVALLTLTQRLVAADLTGRVHGVKETLGIAANGVGAVATSGVLALMSDNGALVVAGALMPLAALVLLRRLRALRSGVTPPPDVFERLRSLDLFAPLPIATVESVALRAHREAVPAGTVLIREGEEGDTFFVIDAGTFEVDQDGVRLREQGAGTYFGEIALLHGIQRTATVRAATDAAVLTLDAAGFEAAVGAHARSMGAARSIAGERVARTSETVRAEA